MPRPTSLSDFTNPVLQERYPHAATLPWVVDALLLIQHSNHGQYRLSPEALVILNICVLPMPGFRGTREELLDADVDARFLFETQRNYDDNKRDVDLYRLSQDISKVWKTG